MLATFQNNGRFKWTRKTFSTKLQLRHLSESHEIE